MCAGLSHCFSFIAHVMAHKLIPKGDLPDDSHSEKRGQETETLAVMLGPGKGHKEKVLWESQR